jgi:flap endonuclease-1
VKDTIDLATLRGRRLAVDGNGELYQFLALIRQRDGTPLHDATGRVTSHLSGLFYRTTRRRAVRKRYDQELADARAAGDLARAYSKATMTSRLTREMVDEAMTLLRLMGLPTVQAPSEGEAQAAHMARAGSVWTAASKDYDSLLFGAPRLVRFLTISGKEFLPSKGTSRAITPELIDLERMLGALEITPLYQEPEVTDDYATDSRPCDVDGVVRFLCEERVFSEGRVRAALERAFPEGR